MATLINIISFLALLGGVWAGIQKIYSEHDVIFGIGIMLGALALIVILQDVGGVQKVLGELLSSIMKSIATQAQQQK